MPINLTSLLQSLPGAPSTRWPEGEPYALAFEHGTMSLGVYAPRGRDPQTPHRRDEIYLVQAGRAELCVDGERRPCAAGDALFVPAGVEHRFEHISEDFVTWVVFWGPAGGEAAAGTVREISAAASPAASPVVSPVGS